jgi:hypothetical protein
LPRPGLHDNHRGSHPSGEQRDREAHEGQRESHHCGEEHARERHHRHRANETRQPEDRVEGRTHDTHPGHGHVGGRPGDQVADATALGDVQAQVDQPARDTTAQIRDAVLARATGQVGADGAQRRGDPEQAAELGERSGGQGPREDRGEQLLDDDRLVEADAEGSELDEQGDRQ